MPVAASSVTPADRPIDDDSRRGGDQPGIGAAWDGSPAAQAPPGLCPKSGNEILVVGYLSAVAAALDERGIAVLTLHLDGRGMDGHREVLCGTLALRPAAPGPGRGSWGPTQADWHEDTGWSARLRRGINGHLTVWRYLCAGAVPDPAVVAGFIAALAAGRGVGTACPVPLQGRRDAMLTRLGRFVAAGPS